MDDGVRPDGIADSEDLSAASDHQNDHSFGGEHLGEIVDQLLDHVETHGLIDELKIYDHGGPVYVPAPLPPGPLPPVIPPGTSETQQQFGDVYLRPEDFGDLEDLLADDAVVILMGCGVGDSPDYVQGVADVLGCDVVACTGIVRCGVAGPWWPAEDEWILRPPTSESAEHTLSELGLIPPQLPDLGDDDE